MNSDSKNNNKDLTSISKKDQKNKDIAPEAKALKNISLKQKTTNQNQHLSSKSLSFIPQENLNLNEILQTSNVKTKKNIIIKEENIENIMQSTEKANEAKKPHYLGHRSRQRNRLLRAKEGYMEDVDLLEMLLFYSLPRQDTKKLAKDLIARFGNLHKILHTDPHLLKEVSGIGTAVISSFKLIREVSYRIIYNQIQQKPILDNWQTVISYLQTSLAGKNVENLKILFLDNKLSLINEYLQDVGTVDHTPFYVREIIKKAMDCAATSIILSHNHLSGDARPSKADIIATNSIVKSCKLFDLDVHDHIIIAGDKYFSFKSENLL